MPQGLPTPEEILDGNVAFFSLDTDVIQGAGYNFGKGPLNQLPRQLPRWMKLQLTEVVLKEVMAHRMEPVAETLAKLNTGMARLQRLSGLDLEPAREHVERLNVLNAAKERFGGEVRDYVAQCRGEVLSMSQLDSQRLFELYFAGKPPFGFKADKKSEFPDAAALILLEQHVRQLGTKAIVASKDKGWQAFAEQSDHLYCVTSLDELASLFIATDARAQAVKDQIKAAIQEVGSALRTLLTDALEAHIADATWDTNDLYSGSPHRFEAEVASAELDEYEVNESSLEAWEVDDEPGAWLVELKAEVRATVVVSIQWFVWDSIDREEVALGSQDVAFAGFAEVEAYVTCYDVKLDSVPATSQIEIEIGSGSYGLGADEIELDLSGD